jgi:hypothetical protein
LQQQPAGLLLLAAAHSAAYLQVLLSIIQMHVYGLIVSAWCALSAGLGQVPSCCALANLQLS